MEISVYALWSRWASWNKQVVHRSHFLKTFVKVCEEKTEGKQKPWERRKVVVITSGLPMLWSLCQSSPRKHRKHYKNLDQETFQKVWCHYFAWHLPAISVAFIVLSLCLPRVLYFLYFFLYKHYVQTSVSPSIHAFGFSIHCKQTYMIQTKYNISIHPSTHHPNHPQGRTNAHIRSQAHSVSSHLSSSKRYQDRPLSWQISPVLEA